MIIQSDRWMPGDLEEWRREERHDALHAGRVHHKETRAMDAISEFFAADTSGYVGVSWGKDSVTVAHLVHRLRIDVPVVWVKIEPLFNPDCELVRDKFLSRFDIDYHEIVVSWRDDQKQAWAGHGLSTPSFSPPESAAVPGFKEAKAKFGSRHVSGVRSQESTVRHFRMVKHGHNSPNTCAPIGWWSDRDVFAYLHKYNLPIHPAYAMSFGGLYSRESIRVDALGGGKGGERRSQWESRYYSDQVYRIKEEAVTG